MNPSYRSQTDTRRALTHVVAWAILCFLMLALAAAACLAQPTENMMWRRTDLPGQGGGYAIPEALTDPQQQWPTQGWVRLTYKTGAVEVNPVKSSGKEMPEFLRELAQHINGASGDDRVQSSAIAQAEAIDTLYVRVPAAKFLPGRAATVRFPNGVLIPRVGHRYQLPWGDDVVTLTVHDGLRNKAGVAYGHGARYELSYGGQRYTYVLDGSGWDTVVRAVADLDGDMRPDLMVSTGEGEFLLLSSQAKPGTNKATATLFFINHGC